MKTKLIIFLAILIPFILVYRSFFTNTHLAFGDAPYFYQENLRELFNKPLMWNNRNDNFGANQNYILWLFLPTFLYGILNNFFGVNNDFLVRLVFLFPATILSIFGTWLFLGKFTKSSVIRLLGAILYGFNTYFLLIIDGGQIGVALSYGLFPCTLFLLDKYLNNPNLKNYFLTLLSLIVLFAADIRIFILSPLFLFIFFVFESLIEKPTLNKLQLLAAISKISRLTKSLIILFFPIALINLFWIIPFINNLHATVNYFSNTNVINLITLTNSILLFQPHFPLNEFGYIFPTPFYFGFIPLLLLIGLLFVNKTQDSQFIKKYLNLILMFLLFAFLAKGGSEPFGNVYTWILQNLPLGIVFRDSSKFFIPLIFSASCLLVLSIESLSRILNKKLFYLILVVIYMYLLLLVNPAITGNLQGFLGSNYFFNDYQIIYNNLKDQPGFFRTLWFPERPPLAFSSWLKPALSADTLFKEKPFASMIQGDYDLFFFLHDPMLKDWLKLFGVKYVFFPEDQRKKTWTNQQREDRSAFLNFVDNILADLKLNWPISFTGYEIKNSKDLIFAQKKVVLVLGGMDIYNFLKTNIDLDITSHGFLLLEDGIVEPEKLLNLSSQSAVLVLKDRSLDLDLTMAFLQKNFINLSQTTQNTWGIYNTGDYLKWKYELLKHGLNVSDLGFNNGLIFSSINREKTSIGINISKKDSYYIGIRHIEASDGLLKVEIGGFQGSFTQGRENGFKWDILGPVSLDTGMRSLSLENLGSFEAVNAIALIKVEDMAIAKNQAMKLASSFPPFDLNNKESVKQLESNLNEQSETKLTYTRIDPTSYKVILDKDIPTWIVFSEHFDPNWRLVGSKELEPLPLYSMINGYWVDGNKKELVIKYLPQDQVDRFIVWSQVLGVIILVCTSLIFIKELLKNK